MRKRLALLAVVLSLLPARVPGQTPAAPTPAPGVALPAAPSAAPSSFTLTPERYEKAVAYAKARYTLHFVSFVWNVLVLLAIIGWRVGPRFRDRAEAAARRRYWQAAVFVPLLFTTQAILDLPMDIYGHRLAVRYGISVQGWGSWLWDQAKGLLVGFLIAIPLVWLLYAILRKSPKRWWLWFWLALLPILVFLIFLAPVAIDPLFFRFEPLAPKNPELAARIEEVTVRAGRHIPQQRMFEMNASSKSKAINAYVAGIGASKRVVVWDNTIARATVAQTLFVFGHEMGHYVLGHIPKLIAFLWAGFFVTLAVCAAVLTRWLNRPAGRWGIRGIADWASLPVFLLAVTVLGEVAQPIVNGFVRAHEHDADVFGLEAIHGIVPESQKAAAEAFQILGEVNLSDPDPSPFTRFWLYDHPPLAERLKFAAEYDPWGRGQAPRYLR